MEIFQALEGMANYHISGKTKSKTNTIIFLVVRLDKTQDSNRGFSDLQPDALPIELSGLGRSQGIYVSKTDKIRAKFNKRPVVLNCMQKYWTLFQFCLYLLIKKSGLGIFSWSNLFSELGEIMIHLQKIWDFSRFFIYQAPLECTSKPQVLWSWNELARLRIWTEDPWIFSLTFCQLSYQGRGRGLCKFQGSCVSKKEKITLHGWCVLPLEKVLTLGKLYLPRAIYYTLGLLGMGNLPRENGSSMGLIFHLEPLFSSFQDENLLSLIFSSPLFHWGKKKSPGKFSSLCWKIELHVRNSYFHIFSRNSPIKVNIFQQFLNTVGKGAQAKWGLSPSISQVAVIGKYFSNFAVAGKYFSNLQ